MTVFLDNLETTLFTEEMGATRYMEMTANFTGRIYRPVQCLAMTDFSEALGWTLLGEASETMSYTETKMMTFFTAKQEMTSFTEALEQTILKRMRDLIPSLAAMDVTLSEHLMVVTLFGSETARKAQRLVISSYSSMALVMIQRISTSSWISGLSQPNLGIRFAFTLTISRTTQQLELVVLEIIIQDFVLAQLSLLTLTF